MSAAGKSAAAGRSTAGGRSAAGRSAATTTSAATTSAAAGSAAASSAAPSAMESLSAALLLRILRLAASAAGPGHAGSLFLLDVAPRVCRRWRDAARDPDCWPKADVVVTVPHSYWRSDASFKKACRLVARSRGIRNLLITCADHIAFEDKNVARYLGKALQASRAVVEGVSMSDYVWENMTLEHCSAFVQLLERSKMHIRWLHVCIDPRSTKKKAPKRPKGQPPVHEPRILSLIAQMPLLETLWLHIEGQDPDAFLKIEGVHYGGELASLATSSLRALTVYTETRGAVGRPVVAMVNDLLRCGAASLETVKLLDKWELPKRTLQLLSACPRLTTLSANPSCLGAGSAGALSVVRKLILDVCVDLKGKSPAVNAKAKKLVTDALARFKSKSMPNLKAVSLVVWVDCKRSAAVVSQCDAAIKEFKLLRPTVDVQLKIVADDWCEADWKKPVFPFSSSYDPDERYYCNDWDYDEDARGLDMALAMRGAFFGRPSNDDCVVS